MRAAKKHAKVLLFSELGKYFHLKVTLFPYFLIEKLKLLNRLCKISPIFGITPQKNKHLRKLSTTLAQVLILLST
jgi:hypothetical protein